MLDISKDNKKIISLIKEYRETNNIQIRNRLIEECYKSLMRYAGYFYRQYKILEVQEYEDLMIDAFIEVLDRFNINSKSKLITYYHIRAKGTVLDVIRTINRRRNIVSFFSLDRKIEYKDRLYSYYDLISDKRIDLETSYLLQEAKELEYKYLYDVYKSIKSIKSKSIFKLYYIKGCKVKDIANILNISSSLVCFTLGKINKQYFPEKIKKRKNLTK